MICLIPMVPSRTTWLEALMPHQPISVAVKTTRRSGFLSFFPEGEDRDEGGAFFNGKEGLVPHNGGTEGGVKTIEG